MSQLPNMPPDSGHFTFTFPFEPVSLQATSDRKKILLERLRNHIGECPFLLTEDVKVEIEWQIHERVRYEQHGVPDVDNIIKVVLDALQGPDGLLVNDCQVQSITAYWTSGYSESERFTVAMHFDPDAWIEKKEAVFVKIFDSLCMPLCDYPPEMDIISSAANHEERFREYRRLLEQGFSYLIASGGTSIQRVFHSSHLRGFTVVGRQDLDAIRSRHPGRRITPELVQLWRIENQQIGG
jgi:Holliday junction resolvase RusA-like endonuclease